MDAKSDDLKQEVVEVAQTLAAAAQAAGGTDVLAVDPKTLTHEVVKEEVSRGAFRARGNRPRIRTGLGC